MSVTFSIHNPKAFFIPKKVLSVRECLMLMDDLVQVGVDECADGFDGGIFYALPLDDFECLHLACLGKSGRGFELSFQNDTYQVRINTPAAMEDWQQALSYLGRLSQHLDRPIISEYGDELEADDLMLFDCTPDVMSGLHALKNILTYEPETEICEIYGVAKPMAFNRKMIDEVLASEDPVRTFSDMLIAYQNIDAYFARQMFFEQAGELIGFYVLSEGVATILPAKPTVSIDVDVEQHTVKAWHIVFMLREDPQAMPEMIYGDFFQQLTQDEYQWVDGKHVLVHAMTGERMRQLATYTLA